MIRRIKQKISGIVQAYKKDYRHYICSALTLVFIALAIFYFRYAGGRILESLNDIKTSAIYYASELFELNLANEVTINNFTKMPFEMPFNLPNTWEEFKVLWNIYWNIWASKENFFAYLSAITDTLYYFSKFL